MNSLKMWSIEVTHPLTGETVLFLGQGTSVLEAVTDGAKNLGHTFRPKTSGQKFQPGEVGGPSLCTVRAKDGIVKCKPLAEFEADPLPVTPPASRT